MLLIHSILQTGLKIDATGVVPEDDLELVLKFRIIPVKSASCSFRVTVSSSGRTVWSRDLHGDVHWFEAIPGVYGPFKVSIACLSGQGRVRVYREERPIGFESLPSPSPNQYLGSNEDGVVGYYPLPEGLSGHTHVFGEIPSGSINGDNGEFVLSKTPSPPNSLMLFVNGVLMREGVDNDFTLEGSRIIFVDDSKPTTGDSIISHYTF